MIWAAGANQRCHGIMSFKNEFLAKYPITFQITCSLEFRQHGIMRLVVSHRIDRAFVLANDSKISNPRC